MTDIRMKRYSKRRGAGDQTSGGRGKLLRPSTSLSRIELVVRETLQNSWDARDEDWIPAYGIRVYELGDDVKDVLRDRVFTDLPGSLDDLAASLRSDGTHAIEIFDRGTTGLDGPFRASAVAGPGESNNFNSFVFDIGTTKSSARSGGTYGFGKTATFEVSRAHSVVYWSRCRTASGELEHRLIAATLHDPYEDAGARFTGAHWWGDPADEDIVPLRGDAAEQLGERIFRTHFGDDETGTSILVIDPVISVAPGSISTDTVSTPTDSAPLERVPVRTETEAQELVAQLTNALADSAWPKTVPAGGEHPPMIIQVHYNGVEQGAAAEIRGRYSRFADALTEVRKAQGQHAGDSPDRPALIVREQTYTITLRPRNLKPEDHARFFGGRSDNTVGHLHIVSSLRDSSPVPAVSDALCLMRSEAELVVAYDKTPGVEDETLQWHAVFKPTPECDKHFASSEPPTHDNWNPSSADNEISAYVVEKSLQAIRKRLRDFLSEHRPPQREGERSVRAVATGLRGFVPFGAVDEVDDGSPSRRGPRASARRNAGPSDTIDVVAHEALPDGSGQRLTVLPSSSDGGALRITATVYAVTADGRLALDQDEYEAAWMSGGRVLSNGIEVDLPNKTAADLVLRTRVATAVELDLRAERL